MGIGIAYNKNGCQLLPLPSSVRHTYGAPWMYLILLTVFTNDVIAGVVEWEGKAPNSANGGLNPPTTLRCRMGAFVEGSKGAYIRVYVTPVFI